MQTLDGLLVHSASDLNAFSECLHLTALERIAATGGTARPIATDATAGLLSRKGEEHEQRHLERLREQYGENLVAFTERPPPTRAGYEAAERESVAAMDRGVDVIYQATFFDGVFLGRADFLQKVDRPSLRWAWSYEVVDTKLALSPKPYFLVQLCNYSEHVARIQGAPPAHALIVLGTGEEQRFRLADYAAYYRRLKASYLTSVERKEDAYPFECPHCVLCVWNDACTQRRDSDDHLSIVAGMRRDQIRKLEGAGIATVAALAVASDAQRPTRLSADTYADLRAQAAEQNRFRVASKTCTSPAHSYTFRDTPEPSSGFARLPEPNAGDVFFDMEGDPMYRPGRALEYLFGIYLPTENVYRPFWATTPADEQQAFEAFVDFVVARQKRYPSLHVYHYAAYEMSALKRLMGRFGSRENEIDSFLRAGTFIDLYPVVKQSIWISQPSYSIKKVEALYGFERTTKTLGGDDSIVMFESWLESNDPAVLEDIRAYNEDDCRSTFTLREWLVSLRAERNAELETPIPWHVSSPVAEVAQNTERTALELRLLEGVSPPGSLAELRELSDDDRARWLLGNLIQYHRREQKPQWWEYFHRLRYPTELVEHDRKALGGLVLCEDIPPYKLSARDRLDVYTYQYPEQEHDLGDKPPLDVATGERAGEIVEADDFTGTLRIKLAKAVKDPKQIRGLIPAGPLNDGDKRAAMEYIANAYEAGTLERDHPATFALLLGRLPRFQNPKGRVQPKQATKEAVSGVVADLDHSYLVVQGPPGSGKSTAGAHVIVDLLHAGKRVALASQSHKALHNLCSKVEQTAATRDFTFLGCHKSSVSSEGSTYRSNRDHAMVTDAPKVEAYLGCDLVSATTFAWADANQRGAFDLVVVDEAGQISLADALITSLIARNVVLLGDPQQLPQVSQGSHPEGTDRSILQHLLDEEPTVSVDRGIFLDTSYRLQPDVDRFISEAFYEGRLRADTLNAQNAVETPLIVVAGPKFLAIDHDANTRRSNEEAECIVAEIVSLLKAATITIRDRPSRRLEASDVMVVVPYNLQRLEINYELRRHGLYAVNVGTVDKFQGLEAPIVFYSMATSNSDLAPRGLEFLLSPNRLNVAISRSQITSVLVCSPNLLASRAKTVDQMRLINLICLFVEDASGLLLEPRTSEKRLNPFS